MSEAEGGELLAARRRKLEALRADGIDPFPHEFTGVEAIAAVKGPYDNLPAGVTTEVEVRVAGRLTARREAGKAAFLDIADRSGHIQLHARIDLLGEERFQRLLSLDLGDVIGVDGTVMRTRRGELSLSVEDFADRKSVV